LFSCLYLSIYEWRGLNKHLITTHPPLLRFCSMSSKSWTNLLIMKTNKALKSPKTTNQQRSWCKNVKMNLIKSWPTKSMALLHLLQNKKKNMNYNNSTWMLKSKSIIRLPLVPVKLQFPFSKKKNQKILMLIKIKMTVRK